MNNLKKELAARRYWRVAAAGLLILISGILLSGIYGKWGFNRKKKIVVGVFAGSYWDIENGYYYRILDEAISKFREKHPDYEVVYTSGIRKSDYPEWLAEQFMQGSAPDLFFIPGNYLDTFARIGALHPLDDLIYEDDDFDPWAYYPTAYNAGYLNGNQLAIPYECAPRMMFVNKTILDAEGIDMPDSDWTWEDFLSICRSVTHSTDENGVINQFGVRGYTWQDAFCANSVRILSPDGKSCDFTVGEVGEAISFLERINNLSSGYALSNADFSNGNVAFQPMVFSEYRAYKSKELSLKKYSGFEWECLSMPSGPSGDNVSVLDTLCLGMSKKTSHEKEVWELMKTLTFDEEIQGKIFDYSEGISPLTSLTESEETARILRQGTGSRFNMDTLRFVMEKSIMPRYIKGYGEINEQISIAVQSILESSSNLQMEQIIWNRKLNSYLKNLQ